MRIFNKFAGNYREYTEAIETAEVTPSSMSDRFLDIGIGVNGEVFFETREYSAIGFSLSLDDLEKLLAEARGKTAHKSTAKA